jgi:hypothetical protein
MSAKETFGPIDQLCGGVGQATTVNSRPSGWDAEEVALGSHSSPVYVYMYVCMGVCALGLTTDQRICITGLA